MEGRLRLSAHAIVCTCEETHRAIARAIGKKRCREAQPLPCFYLLCHDRFDAIPLVVGRRSRRHLHSVDMEIQVEADVFLGFHHGQLARIGIVFGRHGVAFLRGCKLFLQVAEPRIRLHVDATAQVYAHFRTVVATQNGTVLHQSHAQTQASCRQSRTHSGHSATHNHKVEGRC